MYFSGVVSQVGSVACHMTGFRYYGVDRATGLFQRRVITVNRAKSRVPKCIPRRMQNSLKVAGEVNPRRSSPRTSGDRDRVRQAYFRPGQTS